jgi:hypothetical protein
LRGGSWLRFSQKFSRRIFLDVHGGNRLSKTLEIRRGTSFVGAWFPEFLHLVQDDW